MPNTNAALGGEVYLEKKPMPSSLFTTIAGGLDVEQFRTLNWEGSFDEYLDIVVKEPRVTRNAYQRLYDMVLSYGQEEVVEHREKITRYKFFSDPISNGRDGVFGLDRPLMRLVSIIKSAAMGYGTERRVLLLHGPVGSAKSTIARLLKKGLEVYSKTDRGALYTFSWQIPDMAGQDSVQPCPMHEEPLKLIPFEQREKAAIEINARSKSEYKVHIEGDLCPFCRYVYRSLLEKSGGDWTKLMKHVRVRRMMLSE